MFYPKQIPYLLDKDFRENIKYKEYKIKELNDYCMCIWTMQSIRILDTVIYNYILPDACIDIVIDFSKGTICFAGFSKDTMAFSLNNKIDFMGVRLKPSAFYLLFGVGADKIMDQPVDFSKIDKQSDFYKILKVRDFHKRLNIFKEYLLKKIGNTTKIDTIQMVEELYQKPRDVMTIARQYDCNEKYLYRMFKTYYGVSPKVLLNILRLHLCLTLMMENNICLVDIAHICGFYDQAHFIKEIKRYTGFCPLQLLEQYK